MVTELQIDANSGDFRGDVSRLADRGSVLRNVGSPRRRRPSLERRQPHAAMCRSVDQPVLMSAAFCGVSRLPMREKRRRNQVERE
jgi:hypothetical protein